MRLVTLLPAVALVAAYAVWRAAGAGADKIPYQDSEAVALGAELYSPHCASCHGASLEGEDDWQVAGPDGRLPAPPHDETGHTWHHPDALLIRITTLGTAAVVGNGYESNMPGFGDVLTDEEIRATLAYIKSTWPDRVIETHNRITAEAGD